MKSFKLSLVCLLFTVYCLLFTSVVAQVTTSPTPTTAVTATIMAPPEAYSIDIESDPKDEVEPGGYVIYTITYSYTGDVDVLNVVLKANWGFETDEVADYVEGSATVGYDGAPPTVDLLGRTIIWKIPRLPAATVDQKVYFSLKVHPTHAYRGTYKFFAQAVFLVEETTMATSARVVNWVTYLEGVPPVVLIPEIEKLTIFDVRILEITAHHALIFWRTNKPADSKILYGLSRAYGLEVTETALSLEHKLSLDNLTADTLYHFQVISTTALEEAVSEDFIFKTAKEVVPVPTADIGSLLIRVFNLRLPPDVEGRLEIYPRLTLEAQLPIYGIDISALLDLDGRKFPLLEQERIFTGAFVSPQGLGSYPIKVRIEDKAGNFFDTPLLTLLVRPPPRVVNVAGKPIERAQVTLYRFNPFISRFAIFDMSGFHQENPAFTNAQGEYFFIVPYGRYFLTVSARGYQPYKGEEIVVLRNGIFGENVVLKPVPAGLIARIFYELRRLVSIIWEYLRDLAESLIVARLVPKLVLPLLVISALFVFWAFLDRFGLTPASFLAYLIFLLFRLLFWLGRKKPVAWGEVLDATTGDFLSLVEVGLFDIDGVRKLGRTFTDRRGRFGFRQPVGTYLAQFKKAGFVVPPWEEAKKTFKDRVAITWSGDPKTLIRVWLMPGKARARYKILDSIISFLKSTVFEAADFLLLTGLVVSLLNLKFQFSLANLGISLAYIFLAILWAIFAFGKVRI